PGAPGTRVPGDPRATRQVVGVSDRAARRRSARPRRRARTGNAFARGRTRTGARVFRILPLRLLRAARVEGDRFGGRVCMGRGSALHTADLTVRKLAAIEALARHGRASAAMLESITVDPALWPTSALIDWIGILQRVEDIPERETHLAEALSQLRARINFQG